MTETNLLAPVASGLRALQPTETTGPNAAERPRGAPPPDADVIAPDDIPRDIAREAASSEKMLEKLIGKATARMPSMTQSILEEFKGTLKRPKLFESGYVKWGKIADAAAKVDKAGAELARIPAAAFRDVPLDPANFKVLRTYTEAQNKLCAALKTFQASIEPTRSTSTVIQNLINATEFRTAEALNLVAIMQLAGKAPDAVAAEEAEIARHANARFDERSAEEAMRELSPAMHGAKVLEGLKTNIAGFMTEVGALEANRKGLSPDALRAAAKSLFERAAELKSSVSSEAFQGQGIAPDELLRQSLEDALAAIAIRLAKMTELTPENIVENALSSMLSKIDADLIEEVLQSFPEQCRPLLENLTSAAIAYNAMTDALTRKVNEAGTSGLSAEAFRDALAATVERLVGKTGTAPGGPGLELLKNLRYLAHQRDNLSGDEAAWLQANIQRQCGIHLSRNEIRSLHRQVQSAPMGESSPLMTLMEGLEGKIAWVGAKILDAEISEISGMYANLTITKPDISSDCVLNAIDRYVSMPCLIDAALRGLPMNQLELRAGQEVLN